MKQIYFTFIFFFCIVFSCNAQIVIPDANGVLYVKKGENGNGSSWSNALGEVADAVLNARELNDDTPGTVTQIWVAGGTYHPMYRVDNYDGSNPLDRDNTLRMVSGVKAYGGFAGTETALAQRDLSITSNESILSGDYNEDDTAGFTNNDENAYHVAIFFGTGGASGESFDAETVLDGFTITGGNANRDETLSVDLQNLVGVVGGGLVTRYNSSPTLSNLKITNNSAANGGAGTYCYAYSSPVYSNCIFANNHAGQSGGAVYSRVETSPVFENVAFQGNTATVQGGALYFESELTLTNALISGNSAPNGAAIYITGTSTIAPIPTITNATITGNNSTDNNAAIFIYGELNLRNSIIYGNSGAISNPIGDIYASFSIIQGGYAGTNITDTDPFFTEEVSYENAPFTNGDYSLQNISPAVNAGNNIYFAGGQTPDLSAIITDLANNPRFYDGGIADLGAYELQGCTSPAPTAGAQTFCAGATVQELTATGTDLLWYEAATGGSPLAVSVALVSGTYYVSQTLNNCESTRTSVEVTVNSVVTPTFDAVAAICAGATLEALPLTSNNGITGAWSPALNNTETTTYTFTPEEGQCADTATMTIEVTIIDVTTSLDNVTITALQTGATYQWINCENGNLPIEGANGQSFTATQNGQYAVIIESGNCSSTSDCVAVTSLSIEDPEIRSDLIIYPNPTASTLNISTNEIVKSFKVFDISGKTLATHNFNDNQVNVGALEAGTYFIEIETETKIYLKRFIKSK